MTIFLLLHPFFRRCFCYVLSRVVLCGPLGGSVHSFIFCPLHRLRFARKNVPARFHLLCSPAEQEREELLPVWGPVLRGPHLTYITPLSTEFLCQLHSCDQEPEGKPNLRLMVYVLFAEYLLPARTQWVCSSSLLCSRVQDVSEAVISFLESPFKQHLSWASGTTYFASRAPTQIGSELLL